MAYLLFGVVVAMAVITLYLVIAPLLRPTARTSAELAAEEVVARAEREKEKVFAALSDVEYDFRMNKLSLEDYQALKARLARRAVGFLKEEEQIVGAVTPPAAPAAERKLPSLAEIDAEIEREVAAELARGSVAAQGACPHCDAPLPAEKQRFCPVCGKELTGS